MVIKPCHQCGKDVKVAPSRERRNGNVFCDETCYINFKPAHSGRRSVLFGKEQARGNKSHKWKGGTIRNQGYVLVSFQALPEHEQILFAPMRNTLGYIGEHRLVVARRLGRPLFTSEIVHHLNGMKSDNRDENLSTLKKSTHSKEHWRVLKELKRLQEENRELRAKLAKLSKQEALELGASPSLVIH